MEYQLLSRVWNFYLSQLVNKFVCVLQPTTSNLSLSYSLITFYISSIIYIAIFCKSTNNYLCCRHTTTDASFSLRYTQFILVFRAHYSLPKVTSIQRIRNFNFTNCSSLNLSGSVLIPNFSKVLYGTRAFLYTNYELHGKYFFF
jgi:hypothetical protein